MSIDASETPTSLIIYAILLGIIIFLLLKPIRTHKPNKSLDKLTLRQRKGERIKGYLDAWIHGGTLPNAVISIQEKGKEIFHHHTGFLSIEKRIPCTRDTIFRIYSMTKPITTIAILILIDRGLLRASDTIDIYLPFFTEVKVHVDGTTEEDHVTTKASRQITIHDLLTHTSGISYAFLTDHLCGRILSKKVPNNDAIHLFANTPMKDLSKYIADSPLCFQPGTRWVYGLNTDVLGHIVELISGQSLNEFFQKEIFEPLQMKKTGFVVAKEDLHKLTSCYEVIPGHQLKLSVAPERDRSVLKPLLSGGGGLVSTIDDYCLFANMLAKEGLYVDASGQSRRLVSAESIRAMRTNHLPPGVDLASFGFDKGFSETVGAGYGFGYGVSTVIDPKVVPGGSLSPVEEFGWGGIASTAFFVDPVNEIVMVFMTQLIPSKAYPVRAHLKWLSHWLCRDDLSEDSSIL